MEHLCLREGLESDVGFDVGLDHWVYSVCGWALGQVTVELVDLTGATAICGAFEVVVVAAEAALVGGFAMGVEARGGAVGGVVAVGQIYLLDVVVFPHHALHICQFIHIDK